MRRGEQMRESGRGAARGIHTSNGSTRPSTRGTGQGCAASTGGGVCEIARPAKDCMLLD